MQTNTSKIFSILIVPVLIIVYFFFVLANVSLQTYPSPADVITGTTYVPLLFPLFSVLCGLLPTRKNLNGLAFTSGLISMIAIPLLINEYWENTGHGSAGPEVAGLIIPTLIGLIAYLALALSFWSYINSQKKEF